jgi:hypothetical protein
MARSSALDRHPSDPALTLHDTEEPVASTPERSCCEV